jgi:hypothetical protein
MQTLSESVTSNFLPEETSHLNVTPETRMDTGIGNICDVSDVCDGESGNLVVEGKNYAHVRAYTKTFPNLTSLTSLTSHPLGNPLKHWLRECDVFFASSDLTSLTSHPLEGIA